MTRVAKSQSSASFSLQNLEPALIYAMALDFSSRALKKMLQNVEHSWRIKLEFRFEFDR
jgi:hypothetical protein